ncbi:MAG: Bcr/CflA family efflux MFS transporter [Roseibium sp.]|uniref:Bcr/CflA family efflux MFS transporter n=1 Tax=Roseibium sp. TaxID=1936156 RepID=UPI001B02CD44|nr:Bcr/CflA family efflux MFS transporter [Roseibium sp.]MBO6893821.1 Bcr/CflA family efflux MFS transporter [Roseibium sp.]MBO6931135.1 Bcr/CflA family efflux MFS transporter [Roseibium sp.]
MTRSRARTVMFVAVLGLVFTLAPFAIDLYLPALPTMAIGLNTSIDGIELSVAVFLLGFALGQLLLGPVSDIYGRKRVLVLGISVFVPATVMIARTTSMEALLFWRAIQALGGGASVAVFPLVRDRFDDKASAQIISYIMALVLIAPVVAPLIGSYILTWFGWQAIFWVLAAIGALALISTFLAIEETSDRKDHATSTGVFSKFGRVLREPRIVFAILAGASAFAGLFAFISGAPYVYITYFGVSPEQFGFLMGANAAAMILANIANARLLADTQPVLKMIVGAVVMCLSVVFALAVAQLDLGLAPLVLSVAIFFGALALVETNAILAALSVMPSENGTVSAINGALMFGVGAIASFAVGILPSTDERPVLLVLMASAIAALICACLLARKRVASSGLTAT